jgi:hypothetical protein
MESQRNGSPRVTKEEPDEVRLQTNQYMPRFSQPPHIILSILALPCQKKSASFCRLAGKKPSPLRHERGGRARDYRRRAARI